MLGGCAHLPFAERAGSGPLLELHQTPFFPQQRYQCGPAALATLLVDSGVETSPATLVDQVWIEGRQGSLQPELLAATRRAGRLPVVLEPQLDALGAAIEAGYPTLVLLNLGARWWPMWHYAVVIGMSEDGWLLRSGTEPRRFMDQRAFERAWHGGGRWAVIAAHPAHVPSPVRLEAWIRAADDLARVGFSALAEQALASATGRWPDAALAWFAYGNQQAAATDWSSAAQALTRAVALRPSWTPAVNNLATVWLSLDCPERARPLMPRLASAPEDYAAKTLAEFQAHQATGPCRYDPQ